MLVLCIYIYTHINILGKHAKYVILINFVSENLSTITHNSRPGTDGIEIMHISTPFRNSAIGR